MQLFIVSVVQGTYFGSNENIFRLLLSYVEKNIHILII
jgi:hypothetical protein